MAETHYAEHGRRRRSHGGAPLLGALAYLIAAICLLPMLAVLLIIILLPDLILALPRWVMPKFVQ